MHPLDGPLLKLERAEEHIRDFKREFDTWQVTKPYGASHVRNPQLPGHRFRFWVKPAPDHLGVVFGDAVNNIRASLDHLIFQLALRGCEEDSVSVRTGFPIVLRPERYRQRALDQLQSVPADVWELIECLQPYHRTDWPDLYYLWLINQLANRDKHRKFNYLAGRVHVVSSTGSDVWLPGFVEDGNILNLGFAPAEKAYEVSVEARIGIAVEAEAIGPAGILTMHHFVRDEVIPLFAGFFDERTPGQTPVKGPPNRKPRRGRRVSRSRRRKK